MIEHQELTTTDLSNLINGKSLTTRKQNYILNDRLNLLTDDKMKKLFGNYIFENEVTIIPGDSNVGKSILTFQLIDSLTSGLSLFDFENELEPIKAIYYDGELSDRNLKNRIGNYQLSANFLHCDIHQETEIFNENFIIDDIERFKPKIIIIDNLSSLALKSTSDGDEALRLMKFFKHLAREQNINIIVITHVPKLMPGTQPSLNTVSGSKLLTNLCDSVLMICQSSKDAKLRYIKHLKARNGERYNEVLILRETFTDRLQFVCEGFDSESNHIEQTNKRVKTIKYIEEIYSILDGKSMNYTDLLHELKNVTQKSEIRCKQIISDLINGNIIIKMPDKKYILNQNESNESEF
jgi:predicted ATP-dependent serine protease